MSLAAAAHVLPSLARHRLSSPYDPDRSNRAGAGLSLHMLIFFQRQFGKFVAAQRHPQTHCRHVIGHVAASTW